MANIKTLQTRANKAANRRGHVLGVWAPQRNGKSAEAICTRPGCCAYVQVDTAPAPNGIDIGGDAVALNCRFTGE